MGGGPDAAKGAEPGRLYLCATPIGNLRDITLRALDVLRSVDVVAAEDTRRTRRLFARHGIETPLTSYREENRERAGARIIERLEAGRSVALVSDAGTPGISDPGQHLVAACLERGLEVEALPGPNAAIAALVVSGLPTRRFSFEGFLPRKAGARARALEALAGDERTLVFHEGPSRVLETLSEMERVFGDRRVAVARELTKRYEQVLRGSLSEVRAILEKAGPRGEFVVVVEGSGGGRGRRGKGTEGVDVEEALEEVASLRDEGLSLKDAVSSVAGPGSGISKSELYNLALARRR